MPLYFLLKKGKSKCNWPEPLESRQKVCFRHIFFQNKTCKVLYKLYSPLKGFTALQTSELFKNQQNQISPYNHNNIAKD